MKRLIDVDVLLNEIMNSVSISKSDEIKIAEQIVEIIERQSVNTDVKICRDFTKRVNIEVAKETSQGNIRIPHKILSDVMNKCLWNYNINNNSGTGNNPVIPDGLYKIIDRRSTDEASNTIVQYDDIALVPEDKPINIPKFVNKVENEKN